MVINIFGKRGSGKTTLIRGNLHEFPGPVAIIDALGNFQNEVHEDHITTDVREFIELLESWKNSTDPKKNSKKYFVLMPRDPSEAVDFVSATLWALEGGTLVLDETDMVEFPRAPCFDDLIRYGRNRRVHIITGCRRPAEISRNITAAANRFFILKTQEPRDIEFYEKTLIGKRARVLMSMPDHSGLFVDFDKNEISKFNFNKIGEIQKFETEKFS